MEALAIEIEVPNLAALLRRFLFDQLYPNDPCDPSQIPIAGCPCFEGSISVFNSASAQFYAPSDLSGLGSMQTEFICSAPMWRNKAPRYDCIFVGTNASDPSETGMRTYDITWVLAFFSFSYRSVRYPCAVIRWFDKIGDRPDEDTGMWKVRPSTLPNCLPHFVVIHIVPSDLSIRGCSKLFSWVSRRSLWCLSSRTLNPHLRQSNYTS